MTHKQSWSRVKVLVICLGVLLIVAAPAMAIYEGYASDAEARGGNIIPAFSVGVAGLIILAAGLVALFVGRKNGTRGDR